MFVKQIVNKPINSNCYVIHRDECSGPCIIVDPGSEKNVELTLFLKSWNLTPDLVILTHEHFDHCWGVNELSKNYSFTLVANTPCSIAIKDPRKNLSIYSNNSGFSVKQEVTTIESLSFRIFWENELIEFHNLPGHSTGSIGFRIDNKYFIGDTMIWNSPTVTKLPGGNKGELLKTLEWLRKNIAFNSLVFSGHGVPFIFEEYSWFDLDVEIK